MGLTDPISPRGNPLLFPLVPDVAIWFPTGSTWKAVRDLLHQLLRLSLELLLQSSSKGDSQRYLRTPL